MIELRCCADLSLARAVVASAVCLQAIPDDQQARFEVLAQRLEERDPLCAADRARGKTPTALNYWFTPNLVGKIAYEFNRGLAGEPTDNNRWLLQAAYGF